MPKLFGAKVRYLRRTHQLTQEELAERLGLISRTQLTNVEVGRRMPSLDLVVRTAALFGVGTDYLLRDERAVNEQDTKNVLQPAVNQTFHSEQFGQALRQLRVQHNLTQAQMAQQLGLLSHTHISHLEAGRHEPSLDLVLRIADMFGVSTDQLLRAM